MTTLGDLIVGSLVYSISPSEGTRIYKVYDIKISQGGNKRFNLSSTYYDDYIFAVAYQELRKTSVLHGGCRWFSDLQEAKRYGEMQYAKYRSTLEHNLQRLDVGYRRLLEIEEPVEVKYHNFIRDIQMMREIRINIDRGEKLVSEAILRRNDWRQWVEENRYLGQRREVDIYTEEPLRIQFSDREGKFLSFTVIFKSGKEVHGELLSEDLLDYLGYGKISDEDENNI